MVGQGLWWAEPPLAPPLGPFSPQVPVNPGQLRRPCGLWFLGVPPLAAFHLWARNVSAGLSPLWGGRCGGAPSTYRSLGMMGGWRRRVRVARVGPAGSVWRGPLGPGAETHPGLRPSADRPRLAGALGPRPGEAREWLRSPREAGVRGLALGREAPSGPGARAPGLAVAGIRLPPGRGGWGLRPRAG